MPKFNTTHRFVAIFLLLCGTGWTVSATSARAAVDADVRAGVFMDMDAIGVGAGVLAPMTSDRRWFFNPNMEIGFGDEQNLIAMNGDFHYDFTQNSNLTVWMGAGPAVLVTDPDVGDSDTDVGLNLLTGLGGTSGDVRPFAQLKGVVADNSQVVLQGGIRF